MLKHYGIKIHLVHLENTSEDPKTKSEAESLATNEIENFEFLLDIIIWHNLLFAINLVSKILQTEDMHMDVALDQLKGLISYLETYRETRFQEAMIETKEVANYNGNCTQIS